MAMLNSLVTVMLKTAAGDEWFLITSPGSKSSKACLRHIGAIAKRSKRRSSVISARILRACDRPGTRVEACRRQP
jgi:hypothetical protein